MMHTETIIKDEALLRPAQSLHKDVAPFEVWHALQKQALMRFK